MGLGFVLPFLVIFSASSLRYLRAISFASFSPTLSLHHILADPLSASQNKESLS
jgi:hypothetical protein